MEHDQCSEKMGQIIQTSNTWSEGFRLFGGFNDSLFDWWLMWQKVINKKLPKSKGYTIYNKYSIYIIRHMNTWPSQILIGLSKTCSAIGIQTWILLSMRRWKKKWKNNHNNSNQSPKALHEWLMNLPLSSKTTCIVAWFLPNPCNDHHHIWHEAHRRLVHVPQQELLPRQQLVIHLSHALLEVGLAEILWPTGPKTPFEWCLCRFSWL